MSSYYRARAGGVCAWRKVYCWSFFLFFILWFYIGGWMRLWNTDSQIYTQVMSLQLQILLYVFWRLTKSKRVKLKSECIENTLPSDTTERGVENRKGKRESTQLTYIYIYTYYNLSPHEGIFNLWCEFVLVRGKMWRVRSWLHAVHFLPPLPLLRLLLLLLLSLLLWYSLIIPLLLVHICLYLQTPSSLSLSLSYFLLPYCYNMRYLCPLLVS